MRKTVVCEKTDGVRFFLCEVSYWSKGVLMPSIWLMIDREYNFRQVAPNFDDPPQEECGKKKAIMFQLRNANNYKLEVEYTEI